LKPAGSDIIFLAGLIFREFEMIIIESSGFKPNKGLLFFGILMILAGVWVALNPDAVLLATALYLGVAFLLGGIGYLSVFGTLKSGGFLALGLLDIIVGLVLITNLGVTAASLTVLLALWVVCVGVIQIAFAMDVRSAGLKSWTWTLVSGIAGLVFGVLILAHPAIGAFTISLMLGIYLILYGGLSVAEYVTMKKMTAA